MDAAVKKAALMLSVALALAGCQTTGAGAQRVWLAYSTVLPIRVSPQDTEETKRQVYRANSLHEGVGRGQGATGP